MNTYHSSSKMQLEICANSIQSAVNADKAGADRVEFCDNMAEGGTTPSFGQVALALNKISIEIWPIIRPRGGDFNYSDLEFEVMKRDIVEFKKLGCAGFVFGILNSDGNIDIARNKELVELAKPLPVAFHRAFDRAANLPQALEALIELGFVRVLTSGGQKTAIEGIEMIKNLVDLSANRISIMPGSGVNSKNITQLISFTGAKTFHTTAKAPAISKMQNLDYLKIFGGNDNYFEESSITEIEAIKKALI